MSHSAQAIYDHAPLGARVSYSNGEARPPERFKRKLRDWENHNGSGYLTTRQPGYRPGDPAMFTLRHTAFGSRASMIMIINLRFRVDSDEVFAIVGEPLPGQILCITTSYAGVDELVHIAQTEAEAEAWLERNRFSRPRLEPVPGRSLAAA